MSDWRRAALVLFTLPLLGCPYDSPAPVAEPSATPLDARLAGGWRCVGGGDKEVLVLRFTSIDPVQMDVDAAVGTDGNPFRLHSATLAGAPVLNIEDRKPPANDEDRWSLGRVTFLRPDVLLFELAREEPFNAAPKGAKPADTAATALARGELFEDFCVCIRAEEPKP